MFSYTQTLLTKNWTHVNIKHNTRHLTRRNLHDKLALHVLYLVNNITVLCFSTTTTWFFYLYVQVSLSFNLDKDFTNIILFEYVQVGYFEITSWTFFTKLLMHLNLNSLYSIDSYLTLLNSASNLSLDLEILLRW